MESSSHASISSCELVTGVNVEGKGVLKSVQFRELAGAEEDILASEKMKYSDRITKILQNCTLAVGDVTDRNQINHLVEKFISADRWLYLVNLRKLSVGKTYAFTTVCPDCKKEDKVTYELDQVTAKSEVKADHIMQEIKLPPKDRLVRWQPLNGTLEAKVEALTKEGDAVTAALYARIESIDGKPVGFEDVKNMTLRERTKLRENIQKIEGSLDDEVDFHCPACGHDYKGDLPLDGRSFFYPQE